MAAGQDGAFQGRHFTAEVIPRVRPEGRFFGRRGNGDEHMQDAVNSLRIVLAAEESVRTRQVVTL